MRMTRYASQWQLAAIRIGVRTWRKPLRMKPAPERAMIMPRTKKEMFVCDGCGIRKRLSTNERHWCDDCTLGSPIELCTARSRSFALSSAARTNLAGQLSTQTQMSDRFAFIKQPRRCHY